MVTDSYCLVELSKKIWAYTPGSDTAGYSAPEPTQRFAFGVVGADTCFADIAAADGYLNESLLIGGIHWISGDQSLFIELRPGRYRLYEFTVVRHGDEQPKFAKMGGWQFKAEINGVEVPAIDDENAVPFDVRNDRPRHSIVGINKSFSVQVEKRTSGQLKPGVMFFGTTSYLGIFPDTMNWNASAILSMGVTDHQGTARLDGFTSGCNGFIHEVIPRSDYEAGVRATQMDVLRPDGTAWFSCGFLPAQQVTQANLDTLLRDPRLNAAARDLIGQHLHAGDYLCGPQECFFDRQGTLTARINNGGVPNVKLCKKLWAYVPGSDSKGYSAPGSTMQFAFGVVGADTSFADIAAEDGYLDESRLIGGVRWLSGDETNSFSLPPGHYRLYEFTIVRHDGDQPKFAKMGGWQFKVEIDGVEVQAIGDENAVPFEVGKDGQEISLVGINKTFSVLLEKYADGRLKPGVTFFGTSSYLGIFPDKSNWNAAAVLRVGITDAQGTVRLDGFTSGGNAFIHEVIPKADYEAGVRATQMEVFRLDGTSWFITDVPEVRVVTQADLDALLHDPKLNAAARDLIRQRLHAGDYLCGARDYVYERQGTLKVKLHNSEQPNVRLCKKLWAGTPDADANGYSLPNDTIRYAFGVIARGIEYSQITGADGYVDESKLIGGIHRVDGAQCKSFSLPIGHYQLLEFRQLRHGDGVTLKYERPGGWDFTVEIGGTRIGPSEGSEGVPFEVETAGQTIELVGINKSLSVQVSVLGAGKPKAGTMIFGTSSYLGLAPDGQNWNAGAIMRLGLSDARGIVRLDGFSSGNNVFLHQVVTQADYQAGVRAETMKVYNFDGSLRSTATFPDVHQVTESERAALLREPKLTEAGRQLIERNVQVGDYLFTNQSYFNDRQGTLQVVISNNR
ncbi:hypothetical protein UB43_04725 [Pseudomonas sp. 21]|uniref:hypothetical protein n=1 Tax=unclassified Pseudomonas TaxID=196821 RepID=UPI0005EB3DA4|nr:MULTISPECIES: hypothetical protein [unclassified Pseudomonas]KJK02598.1 hypothetical protein UB43_04725 [Pseudomonas sp. 21]MBV7585613.1 hypothetical protein [Pseudomonas sp. PDM33]